MYVFRWIKPDVQNQSVVSGHHGRSLRAHQRQIRMVPLIESRTDEADERVILSRPFPQVPRPNIGPPRTRPSSAKS